MTDVIKKIIKAGVMAPSGDNCQPWKFRVGADFIDLFNVPEKDTSLYNVGQKASLVAHGAVLENMVITATNYGFKLEIDLFPDKENLNYIARCYLASVDNVSHDSLFDFIAKRATNRKPYKNLPLTNEQIDNLLQTSQEVGLAELKLVTNSELIESLANFLSKNEQLVLENRELHKFLFAHIRWTESEERQMKTGMYIKTLELNPPQSLAFKLFKHWSILKFFNKLGAARKVSKENANIYKQSAAMTAFIASGNDSRDFIAVGRLMQRVWLKATAMNLSAQPLTGITFLNLRVLSGQSNMLNSKEIALIQNSYQGIKKIFGVNQGIIVTTFRIGAGGTPSATSSRLEPDIAIVV